MKKVQCLEACPSVICGMPVNLKKGFDVQKRDGTTVQHFDNFEDAEALRQTEPRKFNVVYWVIVPKMEEEA